MTHDGGDLGVAQCQEQIPSWERNSARTCVCERIVEQIGGVLVPHKLEVVQTFSQDSCHHCKRVIRETLERLEQVVVVFKEPQRPQIMKESVEVVPGVSARVFPATDREYRSDSTTVWRS